MRDARIGYSRLALLCALGALVSSLFWFAGPAGAHHRQWGSWPAEPDRGVHTFCFGTAHPPGTAVLNRARYAMDNNDGLQAQTVIKTQEFANCTDVIDIRFQQRPANGALGDTMCLRTNTVGRCDQWRVRIAWGLIQQLASNPGYQARKTLCHEIGHTVGLAHYGNGDPYTTSPDGSNHSCMRSGIFDGGQLWTRSYGAHDRTAIRDNW